MIMHQVIGECLKKGELVLSEHEAKKMLADYGIPVTKELTADTPREAVETARQIGYPVVLKANAPWLQHKTESGAVILDISDETRLLAACKTMNEALMARYPGRRFQYLVSEMLPPGVEVIVGGLLDPSFGPVVTFGLGGIYAELFEDVAIRVAPMSRPEILDMMQETRAYRLLTGFRGSWGDVNKIADIIESVSRIMMENPIAQLDINPLITWKEGAKAADALIVLEGSL